MLCSDIQHRALFTLVLQSIEKPEKIAKGGFKTGDGSSKEEEEEDAFVDGDGYGEGAMEDWMIQLYRRYHSGAMLFDLQSVY